MLVAESKPLLDDPEVALFCKVVDDLVTDRMKECLGRFCSMFEMLLSPTDIRQLVQAMERRLPGLFNRYMKWLGYDRVITRNNKGQQQHLKERFSVRIFFIL